MDLFLKKVKNEADVYKIPRARQETSEFLKDLIERKNIKSILEIGTGNAFSSIFFAQIPCVNDIYTFEMDPFRITLCEQNVKYYKKIHFFPFDFMKFNQDIKVDMIFIDGTKRMYKDFFEYCQRFSHSKTLFVSDNLNFKDHINNSQHLEYKHRRITDKISEYIEYLKDLKDFDTEFYFDNGDGISITIRNK
jgi:predicted O-methyltransferase YrrM